MYECPDCHRPLANPKQWHNCVSISIDSLFVGKKLELEFIFDQLLATVVDWENVAVSATQNCIVFVKTQTFLVVRPMKQVLDLKFYLSEKHEGAPIYKSCEYAGKWEHHIRIGEIEALDAQVFAFLRQSYALF